MNVESNTRRDIAASIERAVQRLAAGGLILVRDDELRENEGDLVGAAQLVTPEMVAFMAVHGRGLICQSITPETAERLTLPRQVRRNTEAFGTAFTVSVDAADGITTGISAADRARTAAILAHPNSRPEQLAHPGHLFPIVARRGGITERPGHTEASVELVRMAGLFPSGLICEVLNDDGTLARGPELQRLAERWSMPLISIGDLISYVKGENDAHIHRN
jgi:3,4-dihydroxy 2-butanone 4-phosphate synthase/GTP cyclohydrolase II